MIILALVEYPLYDRWILIAMPHKLRRSWAFNLVIRHTHINVRRVSKDTHATMVSKQSSSMRDILIGTRTEIQSGRGLGNLKILKKLKI